MAPQDSGQSRRWPGFSITTVESSDVAFLEAEDFRHLCNKWQWNPGSSLRIHMPHVRWLPSTKQPYIMTPIATSWPKWPCLMMRSAIFTSFQTNTQQCIVIGLDVWYALKKTVHQHIRAYDLWIKYHVYLNIYIYIHAKINASILHYYIFKQKCVCNSTSHPSFPTQATKQYIDIKYAYTSITLIGWELYCKTKGQGLASYMFNGTVETSNKLPENCCIGTSLLFCLSWMCNLGLVELEVWNSNRKGGKWKICL